jgi:hypothetical protein
MEINDIFNKLKTIKKPGTKSKSAEHQKAQADPKSLAKSIKNQKIISKLGLLVRSFFLRHLI